MEPTIKYEYSEENAIMGDNHGQYYEERTSIHSQQQQQQQQQQLQNEQQLQPRQATVHATHSLQTHMQQTHQRQSLTEVTRQRPTHPDFAHLRQQHAALTSLRSTNSEHSSQSRSSSQDHARSLRSQTRQAIMQQQQQQHSQNHLQHYSHAAMKRNYHHMENSYAGGATNITATPSNFNSTENAGYYPAQNLINVAQHTQNIEMFNHTYPAYDGQGITPMPLSMDGKSPKRYKKGEASLLFSPPFFKILPLPYQLSGMVSPNHKDAIAAQCYACGRIVRGNKSISSNFIKHMKRSHPEISKIYDTYKIFRIKAGIMPNISTMIDNKMEEKNSRVVEEEGSTAQEDANDSNDESSPYFDPTTMLDVAEMIEEENQSENSENAEDSMPSGEPSESHEQNKIEEIQHEIHKNSESNTEDEEIPHKLMEALNKMMDNKLKEFVKLTDLPKLKNDIKEMKEESVKTSCGHSDVEDLKNQMQQLKQECQALRLVVQQSQASKSRLQQELQIVYKMLHQKKLIIRHLKIENSNEPQLAVAKLFKERLGLENIEIANCSIIPTDKSHTTPMKNNKECVIVELENPKNSKRILREAHKLKDTGIFIEPEISPFQRKRKNKLMVLRKELLRRKPDIKVLVRNTTLIVQSKNFYWDDVDGLCHSGNGEALPLTGIQYLKTITGLDLTEFIEVLKNYDVQLKE